MACGGGGDMTEELQQGALASTVLADDADDVALLDLERDVLQGPDIVAMALGASVVHLANLQVGVLAAHNGGLPPAIEVVLEGSGADKAEAVLLADIVEFSSYVFVHDF